MTEKQIGDALADLLARRINSDKPAKLDQNGRPQQMMKLPCSGKGSPHLGGFSDNPFLYDGICHGGVRAMAARLLRDMQDDPAGPVCLAAEQKPLLAAALTATLAGGPPLLLPYAPTPDALEQLRRAVAFTRMITDDPALTLPGVAALSIDSADGKPCPPLPTSCDPDRELLRIFTGGSTGSPRLWSKTCANILGEALFLSRHYTITADDRILATVPPHHIYGLLFSVALPLVSGASVIEATPSFPSEIAAAVDHFQPTILVAVPAHYRSLMHQPLPAGSLRLAFSSAGMLGERENNVFFTHNKVGIVEVFGSTETGGIGERNRSRGDNHFTGFPVVDVKQCNGRLAVRSPFLSPDLPVDGEGFFLTADRVKLRQDRGFSFQGRSDNINKVGGKRADLDEIRGLILEQPEVADCLLVALPEEGGRGHRIGALVQGKEIIPPTIRQRLQAMIVPHAIPKIVKIVDRIPVKKNGKYDRQAAIALLSRCR